MKKTAKQIAIVEADNIKSKIYRVRGLQVMLDSDLAAFYQVGTKGLNQAVKRNLNRFPTNFMFRLTKDETEHLRSQFVTANISSKSRVFPYAFTEHGVLQAASVLNSDVANKVSVHIINAFVSMKKFITTQYDALQRIGNVEIKQIAQEVKLLDHDKKLQTILTALSEGDFKTKQGIFFDGQVFEAYHFVSNIIRKAKQSIILIDNYIDDSVLVMLTKKSTNVKVTILTRTVSQQLALDAKKYNADYPIIELREFTKSHDRFLIIDDKDVYHLGASLKDLGKKWCVVSKMEKDSFKIIHELEAIQKADYKSL